MSKRAAVSADAPAPAASKRARSGEGGSDGAFAGAGPGEGARYAQAPDAAAVQERVGALRAALRAREASGAGGGAGAGGGGGAGGARLTLADLGITGATEVGELSPDEVLDGLEAELSGATASVLRGAGFSYAVPSRASGNQRYVAALDRIVLMDRVGARPFASVASVRKATVTTRAMQLIYDVLRKGIHVTKRDLFYTDVKLFVDQKESDAVLDDVATMVGCTRTALHVVASDKGIVVGRLSFRDDGDLIDCTRMGIGGKAIPPFIDRISDVRSDAAFILLVEKEAAFMRIAEDRFYNRYPCSE